MILVKSGVGKMTRHLGKYFQPGVRFTTKARWVEKSGEMHAAHCNFTG
jgi:hypothetical protein